MTQLPTRLYSGRLLHNETSSPWLVSNTTYDMRKLLLLALLSCTLGLSSACVYRANISQGNLLKQEDMDQVETGMTRNQVRFLLGTPLIDDPFHQARWDYVYYITIGRDPAVFKRWVTIVFADDIVTELHKDQELNPDL